MLTTLFARYGPDSFIGRVSSTMMGSSETIFYTVSLYYGSVGVKKTRYTIPAALISAVAGLIASILICRLVFGA
jgi:spore maturation protein B